MSAHETAPEGPSNFIRAIIQEDLKSGKYGGRVVTRFPPEPNGYLHIGHAKSICLNFGLALEGQQGVCHLRYDDTDPTKEDLEYVESIQNDVRWLGFDWKDKLFFASDYYPKLYEYAVELVKAGKAYVCSLDEAQIREYRGTVKQAGRLSPYRTRTIDENLDLLERMRKGEFPEGAHILRAKIDMASPNMKMRDPLMYRIRKTPHYRTGTTWCIYPLYDFAHCLSDSIERITHSICTLEFENNRELYDWFLNELPSVPKPAPQQYEFARLSLTYTMMSKRKLLVLVEEKHVAGWDDPRMPTIAGLRRKGVTPSAIRAFCDRIGVARANSQVDLALFEHAVRDDLNTTAPRVMAVLRPLKVVIDNYPEGQVEEFEAPNLPDDPAKMGSRKLPFSREIYIEREDFMEDPPKKFFRLSPGNEVRLRWAYLVRCTKVVKNATTGEVEAVHCTYDPDSRNGNPSDGRKVKGTLHWVSAAHAKAVTVRIYDQLFAVPDPSDESDGLDWRTKLNPKSLEVVTAQVEPSLAQAAKGQHFQFERQGYFFVDPVDGAFNRTVALRDSWAKIAAKGQAAGAQRAEPA